MSYNKFGNTKVVVDGIKFDSKKEANRYGNLKLLQKAGEISDLKLQVKIEILVKEKKIWSERLNFHWSWMLTSSRSVSLRHTRDLWCMIV